MRIGYLMNTYPVTSATFIRREIAALEREGLDVTRFAIRPWDQPLVEAADKAEADRTTYLLPVGALRLMGMALVEGVTNPAGMFRAKMGMFALWGAGGGAVRHIAYLLEAVHLKQRARKAGLRHVHAHYSTNTAAVALLCQRLGGPGFSFTAHGPDEFVNPGPASLSMKLAEARFAIAISDYAKVQLALAGGMSVWHKLHVVRCGVSLDDLPAAPPPASDAPFVTVGRLCKQKAQTLIALALAEVVKTHPNARVDLIGDGDTRPQIEAIIADHGLGANMRLLGWADNATVAEALGNARALLLPSFAEGLPIVIMEAHARARPVISTQIAAIPELVDNQSGWLVPAGNVPALVSAMRACLDTSPEDLASMGQTGRDRVKAAHEIQANAAALARLFRSYAS